MHQTVKTIALRCPLFAKALRRRCWGMQDASNLTRGARILLRLVSAGFVSSLLTSCGGGGGAGAATPTAPSQTYGTAILNTNVQVWDADQLASIQSEDLGQITTSGTAPAVGDIVLTSKTALKVSSVQSPDSTGRVKIIGTTPALEEVASTLQIHVTGYQPSVEQFVPAPGVTFSRASVQPLAADRSQGAVSTQISLSLDTQLADNVHGKVVVTFAPTFDFDFSSIGPTGTASITGALSVQPAVTISGEVGSLSSDLPLGHWAVPLAIPPLPLGMVGVDIPLTLHVEVVAGKVEFTVSATGTADYGTKLTVSPTDADMTLVGNGFTFTQDDQFVSFGLGAAGSLDMRVGAGIALSTMFGLSEPLAGILSGGVKGTLTYADMPQAGSAPFDVTCLSGKVDLIQKFSVRVALFGLSRTKETEEAVVNLHTWSPSPQCSSIKLTAPMTATENSPVVLSAALSNFASLSNPPTGTVTFKVAGAGGAPLCTDIPIDAVSGGASCSAMIPGTGDVEIEADYSGDSVYAGASDTADVLETSPTLDASIASAACVAPGTTLNDGIATYVAAGTATGSTGDSFAIEAWGAPSLTGQFIESLVSFDCGGWTPSEQGASAALTCTRSQSQPATTSWNVRTRMPAFTPMYFFSYLINSQKVSSSFGPLDACPPS